MQVPTVEVKKILYATDLSKTAVHAYAYAASLAGLYCAGITILHVLTEFPGESFVTNMIDSATWKEIKRRHFDDAREQLIGRQREGVAIKEALRAFSEEVKNACSDRAVTPDEILIKAGTPAELIVETAHEKNCDLIVVGTHGHGAITDALIGSTAKLVVRRSTIPVLVVRLPKG